MKNLSYQISDIISGMQDAQTYTLYYQRNFYLENRNILCKTSLNLRRPLTSKLSARGWYTISEPFRKTIDTRS